MGKLLTLLHLVIQLSLLPVKVLLLYRHPRGRAAALTLRHGRPTSDTLALIRMLCTDFGFETIYILTRDAAVSRHYEEFFRSAGPGARIELISTPWGHYRALCNSCILFWQNPEGTPTALLLAYSLIRPGATVLIDHGPITKHDDHLSPETRRAIREDRIDQPHRLRDDLTLYYRLSGGRLFHCAIAQSRTHAYHLYWFYANNRCRNILAYGYPRFFRAAELRHGMVAPALSAAATRLLGRYDGAYRILYAPTRRLDLFEMPGYCPDRLGNYLEQTNSVLFLRLHPTRDLQAEVNLRDQLPRRTEFLPDHAAGATVDLLTQMDCVITDRSSIMFEAFALDRPVIHTVHRGTRADDVIFERQVSLPGLQVADWDELLSASARIRHGPSDDAWIQRLWQLTPKQSLAESYARLPVLAHLRHPETAPAGAPRGGCSEASAADGWKSAESADLPGGRRGT